MFGIHNLAEPIKTIVIYTMVSLVFTAISMLIYKFGSKNWHFAIGKFFIEMVFTACWCLLPLRVLSELMPTWSNEWWFYVAFFALILTQIKRTIAFQSSIIKRLRSLNKGLELNNK